jgi:hypothetical protein
LDRLRQKKFAENNGCAVTHHSGIDDCRCIFIRTFLAGVCLEAKIALPEVARFPIDGRDFKCVMAIGDRPRSGKWPRGSIGSLKSTPEFVYPAVYPARFLVHVALAKFSTNRCAAGANAVFR